MLDKIGVPLFFAAGAAGAGATVPRVPSPAGLPWPPCPVVPGRRPPPTARKPGSSKQNSIGRRELETKHTPALAAPRDDAPPRRSSEWLPLTLRGLTVRGVFPQGERCAGADQSRRCGSPSPVRAGPAGAGRPCRQREAGHGPAGLEAVSPSGCGGRHRQPPLQPPPRAQRRQPPRPGVPPAGGKLGDTVPNGQGGAGPGRTALLRRRGKAPPPAPVRADPPSWYLEERCGRLSLAAGAGQRPLSTMKGGGIENPVFEPPSPDLGRQRQASPTEVDASVPAAEEGPCGWGRCAPRALQLCNNPEGYLAAYSLLAIFQGNPSLQPCPEPQALPCLFSTSPWDLALAGLLLLWVHLPAHPGAAGEARWEPGLGKTVGECWRFGWWIGGGRVPPAAQVWCCC